MPEYLVTWKVDIEADSPQEAARMAVAMHRNPESIANYFTVKNKATDKEQNIDVDLLEDHEGYINTPCEKCGDTETPLHWNGLCANCLQEGGWV